MLHFGKKIIANLVFLLQLSMRTSAVVWVLGSISLSGCTGSPAPSSMEPPPKTSSFGATNSWIAPSPALSGSLVATANVAPSPLPSEVPLDAPPDPIAMKAHVLSELKGRRPKEWGPAIKGVIARFATKERAIALTLDACGGHGGDDYDAELIAFLKREGVKATLFVTSRWITAQRKTAEYLAKEPLFDIENHGNMHRPCSVNGREAYNIRGTRSLSDAVDEIQRGAAAITSITGQAPRFYRPGTAYYDDVCLDAVFLLGEAPLGFAVVGDGGTGFTRKQVKEALLNAKSGSIILLHMNHPASQTAEGVMDAVPLLKQRGTQFVLIRDVIKK